MAETYLELYPNATFKQRVEALAQALVGHATGPSSYQKEYFGFNEDWDITDEDLEICLAFDAIVTRCEDCDWWISRYEYDQQGGICEECVNG